MRPGSSGRNRKVRVFDHGEPQPPSARAKTTATTADVFDSPFAPSLNAPPPGPLLFSTSTNDLLGGNSSQRSTREQSADTSAAPLAAGGEEEGEQEDDSMPGANTEIELVSSGVVSSFMYLVKACGSAAASTPPPPRQKKRVSSSVESAADQGSPEPAEVAAAGGGMPLSAARTAEFHNGSDDDDQQDGDEDDEEDDDENPNSVRVKNPNHQATHPYLRKLQRRLFPVMALALERVMSNPEVLREALGDAEERAQERLSMGASGTSALALKRSLSSQKMIPTPSPQQQTQATSATSSVQSSPLHLPTQQASTGGMMMHRQMSMVTGPLGLQDHNLEALAAKAAAAEKAVAAAREAERVLSPEERAELAERTRKRQEQIRKHRWMVFQSLGTELKNVRAQLNL